MSRGPWRTVHSRAQVVLNRPEQHPRRAHEGAHGLRRCMRPGLPVIIDRLLTWVTGLCEAGSYRWQGQCYYWMRGAGAGAAWKWRQSCGSEA